VVVRASPLQSAAIGKKLKLQAEASFIDPKPGVQQPDVHESIPFLARTCVAVSEVVVASPEQSDDVYEWIVIEDVPPPVVEAPLLLPLLLLVPPLLLELELVLELELAVAHDGPRQLPPV